MRRAHEENHHNRCARAGRDLDGARRDRREMTISHYQLEQPSFVGRRHLLRRGRGGKLLEARIIPKRIEHRIESEQRRC
jgi:hypothetical protein